MIEAVPFEDLQDIYSKSTASLEYLRKLVEETQPRKILELGTHNAVSTRYMASALGSEGHITTIDSYTGLYANRPVLPNALAPAPKDYSLEEVHASVNNSGLGDKITLVKGHTHNPETYTQITGGFNLLFIDATHNFDSVSKDYGRALPLMTSAHIVIFDDAGTDACTVREFISFLHYPFRLDLPYHGGITTLTTSLAHMPGICAAALHARNYSPKQEGTIEH